MGRVKDFYHCNGCDTFLLDDRLDIGEIKTESTDDKIYYICPICKTKNETKKEAS